MRERLSGHLAAGQGQATTPEYFIFNLLFYLSDKNHTTPSINNITYMLNNNVAVHQDLKLQVTASEKLKGFSIHTPCIQYRVLLFIRESV